LTSRGSNRRPPQKAKGIKIPLRQRHTTKTHISELKEKKKRRKEERKSRRRCIKPNDGKKIGIYIKAVPHLEENCR